MAYFDPNNDAHAISRQGKKFITYVGLQMKLLDQQKFVKHTELEVLSYPWENPLKVFLVKVKMTISNKEGVEASYEAVGDAGVGDKGGESKEAINNVGGMVAPSFLRMAETRAHVRALRQATRSEYTASEELDGQG